MNFFKKLKRQIEPQQKNFGEAANNFMKFSSSLHCCTAKLLHCNFIFHQPPNQQHGSKTNLSWSFCSEKCRI